MFYSVILYYFHYHYCHQSSLPGDEDEPYCSNSMVYNSSLKCSECITTVVLVNYSVMSLLMYSQNLLSQSIHLMMTHSSQMMKGYVHLMSMPLGMTTVSSTVYVLNSVIQHTHLHCRHNFLVLSRCMYFVWNGLCHGSVTWQLTAPPSEHFIVWKDRSSEIHSFRLSWGHDGPVSLTVIVV